MLATVEVPLLDANGNPWTLGEWWEAEPSEDDGERVTPWIRVFALAPGVATAALVAVGPKTHAYFEARRPAGMVVDVTNTAGLAITEDEGVLVPLDVRLRVLRWGTPEIHRHVWRIGVMADPPAIGFFD